MAKEEVNLEELFAPELGVVGSETSKPKEDSDDSGDGDPKEPSPEVDLEEALKAQVDNEETEEFNTGEEEGSVESKEDVTTKSGEPPAHDSNQDGKSSDDIDESTTLLFARHLSEQGNLTSFDEDEFKQKVAEEGDEAALSHLWNKESEAIRNEILDTYDQDVKEYLDMLDTGVSPDTAKSLASSRKNLEQISEDKIEDENNEDLRKDLIRQRYKATTRFSDKKIDKLVDQAVSLGEDIDEAKEALEDLRNHYEEQTKAEKEQAKQQEVQAREQAKKDLEDFKQRVQDLEEIVPGMPLNKKQKQGLIDKLTKPVTEVNGQPLNSIWAKRQKDPFKFDTVIAALDDIGVFEGKWDKLTKRMKTDTVNKLKESLNKTSQRTRAGSYRSGNDSDDEVKRNIDAMRGLA